MYLKKFMLVLVALISVNAVAAEQAWISDNLQTSVSDSPDINGKYIGSIRSGTPVSLIEMSKDGRYAHIKTDEFNGWVWAQNIMKTPSLQVRSADLESKLNQIQSKNIELSHAAQNSNATIQDLQVKLTAAEDSASKSRAELVALQRASANVVQIDKRNQELQAQVVNLEQENLNLRHHNARLEESISQKQMAIGGGLVIAGFFLNWFFGLLRSGHRRNRLGRF